ncbi:hypothetical protein TUMSATVNIG1_59800 (plasmid) [Vibrio nigripulchritudo]|uniref:hypothetical protein n=1 Tax=Vibrio nigripulchritudo TaxID=28173 RepID=UPI00190B5F9B|nr:hypothetical protein [Vibrio nigripulchritudo]BCL73994.1 hypothetical protein VNTUMSATTG_59310 [Vibrio nigripulchritudo]BDU35371.1 hypothetical protein TUMSATVNIG1_59800 [Vibrio nigripulchritudo]
MKLNTRPEIGALLHEYVLKTRDENVNSRTPLYEEYSLYARKIPFIVYDHPTFVKRCSTAFTDFRAIYFNADFLLKLKAIDDECIQKGKPHLANHVVFVIAHEIAHCLREDNLRLTEIHPGLANVIQDTANNLDLLYGLGIRIDIDLMAEHGIRPYGVSKEEMELYGGLSIETISKLIFDKAIEEAKALNELGQNGEASENSPPQRPDGIPSYGHVLLEKHESPHVISPSELQDLVEEAGLNEESKEKLGLGPKTEAELDAIVEANRCRSAESYIEMEEIYDSLSETEKRKTRAGNSPGFYRQKVELGKESKITWQMALQESTTPGFGQSQYTEEELIDEYFHNSGLYGGIFYQQIEEGGALICLVDTSGSMPKEFLEDGFNEVVSCVDPQDEGTGVSTALVFPADVDIKDVYWELNSENKGQVISEVKAYGGGGTDFTNPVRNALSKAKELEVDVKAVVFFTDLGARAPDFELIQAQLDTPIPPVLFITNEKNSSVRGKFQSDCHGHAVVYEYKEDMVADLTRIKEELEEVSSSMPYEPCFSISMQ